MGKKNQNSYSKLFSNTIIFAIGSFSSKMLVFLLLPLYTSVLSKAEFGTVDLIIQIANLMLPIATLSIAESIIRFGLDREYKNEQVFSTGLFITLIGMAVFTISMPFISKIKFVDGNAMLLFLFVFCASIKMIFSEFVRSRGLIKLYAFNGLLTTLNMVIFNLIFLLGFKLGMTGYLLAIILSDVISIIFLFIIAELNNFINFNNVNKVIAKRMLAYSIPLIPTTILWWVTNVSDRFIVAHILGSSANGLYAVAYKIPTIITTIYAMFAQAWNMSAITEHNSKGKERFYTNVFNSNQSMVYVVAGGVMLFIIPLTKVLVSDEYYISYIYTPILILATVFMCFSSFLGSVYAATKKTKRSFTTSLTGAAINIMLNFLLIPKFGINGASFATFVSYFAVFVFRLYDTKRYIHFTFLPGKIIINTLFLGVMAVSLLYIKTFVAIPLVICFLIIVMLNYQVIMKAVKKVLPQKILRLIPFIR